MKARFAITLLVLATLPALGSEGLPSQSTPAQQAAAALSPTGNQTPTANEDALTLPRALALALATSRRLAEARSGVALAQGQKRGARAEGRPSLSATAGESVQGPTRGLISRSRQFEGNLDLNVPIDTNGRVRAGKRGAGHAEQAARARVDAEAQRLVLDVTEAYLDSLQARDEVGLVSELRRLNEERLRVARVRVASGIAQPLELSETEADLAQAVHREIEAGARVRQRTATLNTLIGRPAAAPLVLVELAPGSAPAGGAASVDGMTPEQARSVGLQWPDLKALRAEVARAEAGVAGARAARRPALGLGGNLVERVPETFLGGFAWSLGLSLVQSIFDGGRTRARVEEARAERARAGAALAEAERLAEEQVEQARVALDAAEKRLAAEDQRVVAAGDSLDVARKQLAAGTVPALQVTEAETVLTRAKTDALTAHYEVSRSRARLAFAAGRAYPEIVAGQGSPDSGQ
jgi:outer membrane protein TolC